MRTQDSATSVRHSRNRVAGTSNEFSRLVVPMNAPPGVRGKEWLSYLKYCYELRTTKRSPSTETQESLSAIDLAVEDETLPHSISGKR